MSVVTNDVKIAVEINVSNDVRTVPDVYMTDGIIKFITNGENESYTYEGGEAATGFLEGHLISDPISGLSNKIDLSLGGAMASLNTCKVTIDNDTNAVTGDSYISRLLSNQVYLHNSTVKIYIIIDNVLYSRFGGVLSDLAYNEKYLTMTCKDINIDNFKTLVSGDTQQIIYGDVGYSPLLLKEQEARSITTLGHTYVESNAVSAYGNIYLSLIISKEIFNEFSGQTDAFVGWYVKAREAVNTDASSGYDEAIKIIASNSPQASFVDTGIWVYTVGVQLEYAFEEITMANMIGTDGLFPIGGTATNSPILNNTNPSEGLFFDLVKFSNDYNISEGDIGGIEADNRGRPYLYTYNPDINDYESYGVAASYSDGIITTNNNADIEIKSYTYINPTGCRYSEFTGIRATINTEDVCEVLDVTGDSSWVNGSVMIDQNLTSVSKPFEYSHTLTDPEGVDVSGARGAVIELTLPDDDYSSYDELYLQVGMSVFSFVTEPLLYSANDLKLYIKTLPSIELTYRDISDAFDNGFKHKMGNNAITSGEIILKRPFDERYDTGTEPYVPTELAYRLEPSALYPPAKVLFSPEDWDDVLPDGCMRKWGSSFKKSGTSGFIQDIDQSITESFTIDTNSIVKDRNGNNKVYLWISGEPNDSADVYENQRCIFSVNNINIIGSNSLEQKDLFIKSSGEILDTVEVDLGALTYKGNVTSYPGTPLPGEFKDYILPTSSVDGYVYIGYGDNYEMLNALNGLVSGDIITLKKDNDTYVTYQLRNSSKYIDEDAQVMSFNTTLVDSGTVPLVLDDVVHYYGTADTFAANVYGIFNDLLEHKNSFTDIEYNTLPDVRSNWEAARVIKEQVSSFDLIKNLAQQSFVGVYTNRFGNIALDAYKDYAVLEYDDVDEIWEWKWDTGVSYYSFNTGNINNKSIKNAKSTSLTNIINNISIKYSYNYATDSYLSNYYVSNVDQAEFPTDPTVSYLDYSNVPDYTTAKILWEHANEIYVRNGINKGLDKNQNLSDCKWYYDRGTGLLSSSIHYYMTNLIEWITKSKNMITFRIPLTADNIKIDMLDRVTFNDVLLTGGTDIIGWVSTVKPDLANKEIELEITTVPTDLIPVYQFIDESSRTIDDQIDEAPVSGEEVDEKFEL